MTHVSRSDIDIEASPAKVWSIIVDIAAYPEWDPHIRRIIGPMRVGSRLTTDMHLPGGRGMTLRPAVLAVEPERELCWIGSLGVSGVLDGKYRFCIEPIGPVSVRFVQEERFSGELAPLILRFMRDSTLEGFTQVNRALKARAEATATANA